MFRSIRWQLQIWHAVILGTVLIVFGCTVSYLQREATTKRTDDSLLRLSHHVMRRASRLDSPPHNRSRGPKLPSRPPQLRPPGGEPAADEHARLIVHSNDPKDPEPPKKKHHGDRRSHDKRRSPSTSKSEPPHPPPMPPPEFEGGHRWRNFDLREMPPFAPPRPATDDDEATTNVSRTEKESETTVYYVIWNQDDKIVEHSWAAPDDVPVPIRLLNASTSSNRTQPVFRQLGDNRELVQTLPWGTSYVIGRSIRHELNQQNAFDFMLAGTGLTVLAIGLVGGWWMSGRAMKPIQTITQTAHMISAANLSRRINVGDTVSELGHLGSVLNSTFDRLESSFEQQVRFTGDASHELRTPLSVILTNIQLALSKDRSADEYRQTLEVCLQASHRMNSLVDALLTLSRMDSGELAGQHVTIDLAKVTSEAVSLLSSLAEQNDIEIETELAATKVRGNHQSLGQVVTNLVTNAIRYNSSPGKVTVSLQAIDDWAQLEVADTGIGIPARDLSHIFERFYRVDKARSRSAGGSGLGLAICKKIVDTHQGEISVESEVDGGSVFRVRIPLA